MSQPEPAEKHVTQRFQPERVSCYTPSPEGDGELGMVFSFVLAIKLKGQSIQGSVEM